MLRRYHSTISLVLGVISLIAWALAAFVVRAVEDGEFVSGIAKKAVEQPAVTNFITEKTQTLVTATLSDNGVDLVALGIQGTMDDAVAAAVRSDAFQAGLASAVDSARADFATQLTSPEYEGKPLELKLDVSATINQTIGSTPIIGDLVPDLTFAPISVEVADADAFGRVRGTYSGIDRTATWAGWVGLLLIAAGIALTPRKRWLIPLGFLWAGLGAGALWVVISWLSVDRVVSQLPANDDGTESSIAKALREFAQQDSIDALASRVLVFALACLAAAVVSFLIVRLVTRAGKRRAAAESHPRGQHEAGTPGHAR